MMTRNRMTTILRNLRHDECDPQYPDVRSVVERRELYNELKRLRKKLRQSVSPPRYCEIPARLRQADVLAVLPTTPCGMTTEELLIELDQPVTKKKRRALYQTLSRLRRAGHRIRYRKANGVYWEWWM